jgi:hypothetical protein
MKPTHTPHSHVNRVLSLRRLGVALLVVASTAMGQTTAPVGIAKPAAYDCSGLAGVALTSCRQLNAAAVEGAAVRSDGSSNNSHDCAGMSGAALATCRELNGQPAIPGMGAAGANSGGPAVYGGGSNTTATGSTLPYGSTGTQSTTGNTAAPSLGATTPIPQQTTGGTNPITPSGTGATATTGGTNPITPSGTGATATTGGSNPIAPSGTGVPAAGATTGSAETPSGTDSGTANQPTGEQVPATMGSPPVSRTLLRSVPSNDQVPPPSDRIVPMAPAARSAAPMGGTTAGGGAKAGK